MQAGQTILEAVTAVGIDVPFSCEQGVCGSCEMRVLGGKPDHRDMILSDREKAEGRTMMICCSGSKAVRLVLGLQVMRLAAGSPRCHAASPATSTRPMPSRASSVELPIWGSMKTLGKVR